MWAVAHMSANPKAKSEGDAANVPWRLSVVTDTPNGWLHFFASPPKNNDLYGKMTFFTFKPEDRWELCDSKFLTNNW